MAEQAYYRLTSERTQAVWEAFRQRWLAHREALSKACDQLGHPRVVLGLDGEIIAAAKRDDGTLHSAFNPNSQWRNGGYGRVKRGKTVAAKEAAAQLDEINAQLKALYPRAEPIAQEEGFISHLEYTTKDGGQGWTVIGNHFHRAQPLWMDVDQPIILLTSDPVKAIARLKERADVLTVTPDSWEVPEGYERISKARYDLMVAQYKVEREERGDADEATLE